MGRQHETLTMHCVVLTGASRGFGRALAVEMARAETCLHFILTARDESDLRQTRTEIAALDPTGTIQLHRFDMSDTEQVADYVDQLISAIPARTSNITLINNAGSLGPLQRVEAPINVSALNTAIALNLTAPMVITSRVLRAAASLNSSLTIVNVSSLAAVQPFDCWSTYCSLKAAREMFHRCVAHESAESKNDRVRVLNYAPGPLDTQMQAQVRTDMPPVPLKAGFSDMHSKGLLVDPRESAKILVRLLKQNEFDSGAHIDYYDVSSKL